MYGIINKKLKMKAKLFMTMAAATMILAGCSNDENEPVDNWNGEIRLTSGVTVQTRANSADVPDKQIADGETVKVIVTKQDGDASDYPGYNSTLTADGNGGFSGDPMYYPTSGKGVNIYAFHPANASEGEFSVQEDQSRDEDYFKSDLLYSEVKGYDRQKAAHSLTFKHKLCKLEYVLKKGDGDPDLTDATVQWMNVRKNITFMTSDGTLVDSKSAQNVTITPHATYGAIIVPQDVLTGTKLLKVALKDGGVLYYITEKQQVFKSGERYKYTITVNLTGLEVSSTIADWEPIIERAGDAEME